MTAAPRRAVLFDAYPHTYGGAQRTDHVLARALPARGWHLHTITPADGVFPERLRAEGLPVEVVTAPASLSRYGRVTEGAARWRAALALPGYWVRLARALRRADAEVVHVVDHRGLVLAGVAARLARARLVWHVQALDATPGLNRWGRRLAHCVVVPTARVVPKLPGLGTPRDLRAIPYVVPHGIGAAVAPLAGRAPVVVTTARLHPDKGLDVLVDALATVREAVPGVRVQVVGGSQDGFEALPEELRARAGAVGVEDAVELLGFVDRPHELVARAAAYVQPARERTEILPLAILEAMAVGTPVVATDVGGVAEVVRDGATGLLVPPDQPRALADALIRVLREPDLAERLRDAASALVAEPRFHEDGLVDAVVAAYEDRPGG